MTIRNLIFSTGSAAALATGLAPLAADAAMGQTGLTVNYSFPPGASQGDLTTNILHRGWARIAETGGGTDLFDNSEMNEEGFPDAAGKLVSIPTGADQIDGFTILNHLLDISSWANRPFQAAHIACVVRLLYASGHNWNKLENLL